MLNPNAEKTSNTKRENIKFAIVIVILVIIATGCIKFSHELPQQAKPSTIVEEQMPSSPHAVMQEAEEWQDVLSC